MISNLGAFGPNMVKIGMTRRLEPMDRVRELGDASVPFGFDVHALFFSEDAVGVEAELHRRFADKRVNRINVRREFFYVTPLEVKKELAGIAGSLLEFVDEPEAEQYRLSLEMGSPVKNHKNEH
ncbi:T5orf172 domain [Chlamydia trachomatis]|nr:T5orf172 domain [Chlamydia trachomatis]CRH92979.1 T5orf172 domain [Chlamydia trachomatis]